MSGDTRPKQRGPQHLQTGRWGGISEVGGRVGRGNQLMRGFQEVVAINSDAACSGSVRTDHGVQGYGVGAHGKLGRSPFLT